VVGGGVLCPEVLPARGTLPKKKVREVASVLRQAAGLLRDGGAQEKFEATDLVLKSIRMLEGKEK
jgi:hypothetical protein